jgi:MFS family permease
MCVVVASVLMVGTLPGRTQGLGLITEPMLRDLGLDRITYAGINLWATILGAAFCLPMGWIFDRFGLRWPSAAIAALLGAVVVAMSFHAGGAALLFGLILLTRALGQSALSVASITIAGKASGPRVGFAMGIYSVLLSLLFAAAFKGVGSVIHDRGWRAAWAQVGYVLVLGVAPLAAIFLRGRQMSARSTNPKGSVTELSGWQLAAALKTPAFWVFGVATALYGLAASGLGLFNESVLAERGFTPKTYYSFLSVSSLIALVGQWVCGSLTSRVPMQRLLAVAMLIYAIGLMGLPMIKTAIGLWTEAALLGLSGGFITVLFFAIWSHAFGRAHLGRIQGAAQMLTVFASAVGPLLFAKCFSQFHSYAPALWILAPTVLTVGAAALRTPMPGTASDGELPGPPSAGGAAAAQ